MKPLLLLALLAGAALAPGQTNVALVGGPGISPCSPGGTAPCLTWSSAAGGHLNHATSADLAGTCTFAATACTVTFSTAYTAAPVCTANDQTAAAPVKVTPSTTGVTLTGGTGAGATDTAAYICMGNPS